MSNKLPSGPSAIPAIILAAGASTRLGQPKQLLRLAAFGEEPLLDRAVRLAHEAGAGTVFVVLGAHAEEIRQKAKLLDCTIIFNPEWQEGIASSLRAGIRAVEEREGDAAAALLMVCDQPALSADHLRRLLTAQAAASGCAIASEYAGHLGVPAVLPREMFPLLLTSTGDQGARAILRKASRIESIAFEHGEWDIDSPDHLLAWAEAKGR
jgi:molybdenum cofactor cytidylyltransferase